MLFFLFIVLAFVSGNTSEPAPAKFIDGEMKITSSNFGNVPMEIVAPRFNFDSDLYVSEDHFCSSQNFEPNVPTCVPCDYSGGLRADGKCEEEDLHARDLPQLQGMDLPDCQCNDELCEGEILESDAPPLRRQIVKSEAVRMVFRYTHTDWEHGFAVRITPVAEGPFDVILSTDLSLNASKMLSYSYATHPFEVLQACPSYPVFGAAAETTTYFVMVLAKDLDIGQFDISIESLPSLGPDEEEIIETANISIGSFLDVAEIGTPVKVDGKILVRKYGFQPPFFPIFQRYVIDECKLLSVHLEILAKDVSKVKYFSMILMNVGVINDTFVDEQSSVLTTLFLNPHLIGFSLLRSVKVVASSGGVVVSVCPEPGVNETNYVVVTLTGGYFWRDFDILIHVRDVTTSPYWKKSKIGELNPLQFQRRLHNSITLQTPCLECDECESPLRDPIANSNRFFNRRNAFSRNDFTNFVSTYEPPCDLHSRFSSTFDQETTVARCLDLWRDTTCGVLRVIPVLANSGNPRIYPMPVIAQLSDSFHFRHNMDLVEYGAIKNNSISVLITLSANDIVYILEEKVYASNIHFNNPSFIHTEDGGALPREPMHLDKLDTTPSSCNQEAFQQISSQMTTLENVLDSIVQNGVIGDESQSRANVSVSLSSGAVYGGFALMFSDEWNSCKNLSNKFVEFEDTILTASDTSECVEFAADDPCCNTTLQWQDCCSAEGRTFGMLVSTPLATNDISVGETCSSAECVSSFVDDYRRTYQQVNVESGCRSLTTNFLSNTGELSTECADKWIGDDVTGMLCATHDDCITRYDVPDARCDMSVQRCVGIRKEMEWNYLDCLVTGMDSVSKSAIFSQLLREGFTGIPSTQMLHDFLVVGDQCVTDYGPMSSRRPHFRSTSLSDVSLQLCQSCYDVWCLARVGCKIPLQCLDFREVCDPTMVSHDPKSCFVPQESDLFCNWDNSNTSSAACLEDEFKCMYCHNSTHCEPLPATTQSECENTPICVLKGGEILWDVSQSECEEINYCNAECFGSTCQSAEECETIGGVCEDNDFIQKSIQYAADTFEELSSAIDGVCVTPIQPFNNPPCPFVTEFELSVVSLDTGGGESFDFTTLRGCVVFSNCTPGLQHFASGTGSGANFARCERTASDENECAFSGGRWLALPIQTRDSCENPLSVSQEEFPGFCQEGGAPHLSQKGREDCLECGGVPQSPAKWLAGRWITGISETGSWGKTEMVSNYHFVSDSISFIELNSLFELSFANVKAFQDQVSFSCSISSFINTYGIFSCDCDVTNVNQTYEDCASPYLAAYEDDAKITIGGVWFCPQKSYEVGVLSGRIGINGDWMEGSACQFAEITLAPSEVFVGNHERLPLTIFGDPNEVDPLPVRNEKGASVGEVLGDGLALLPIESSLTDDLQIAAIEIMLFIDPKKLSLLPDDYVFDFGLEVIDPKERHIKGELEVRPLNSANLSITRNVGELLDEVTFTTDIRLSGLWSDPLGSPGARIYPIGRIVDWEKENKNDVLTDGERAMIIFFAVLYALADFVVIFIMFYHLSSGITNTLLCFFVILTFTFRVVYLSMFAAGYFRKEESSSFALVEPPSFFILTIASIMIMSFGFCLYCIKHSIDQERILLKSWSFLLGFNVLLYVFMGVILALLINLDTDDNIVSDCFGRQVEIEEDFTVETIRIAYHSCLFVVAFVSAILVNKLARDLESSVKVKSLLKLSILSSVSVLLTSLLWVIYSAVSGSSPYFVIPLFFCECPTLLALCVLVQETGGG